MLAALRETTATRRSRVNADSEQMPGTPLLAWVNELALPKTSRTRRWAITSTVAVVNLPTSPCQEAPSLRKKPSGGGSSIVPNQKAISGMIVGENFERIRCSSPFGL